MTREQAPAGQLVETVISPPVIAAVAAHAAARVPGVVRLEPGLRGLAGSLSRIARQRIKGLNPAPTEGVRAFVEHDPPDLRVEIDLSVSGLDQAAATAQAVQRAVGKAVTEATGLTPSAVSVSILDIEIRGGLL
ncbi:Asp23/Gls24 family envelope stress response protein [Amycolatopsis alba]|uniref:Asp23/Gls24 family envelope stress response protein n=1 Tax=Amycolatopsis alba DSM 44262 TaxID=1125972 RepID=A0A229RMQ2_AMYAL|nr:Asp23/Gls24 family envelope stress response protein [Amycolatopsis alba]OXM47948.1 Asp23/Gls24 family envelope stress response protein [Amycolatopsis alba DSM 44262]